MRVLHLLEATLGGTRTHVLDLLPALDARGWQCGLAYSSLRNPAFPEDARALEASGVRTWDVPMRRGPHASDARALRELIAVARAFRPRLLHAHSSKAGFLARFVGAALRVPVVYTPHCVAFDTALPHAQRRLARWAEVALSPFSARFIAVSQAEARALSRVMPRAKPRITLIRNGLDLRGFSSHAAGAREEDHAALTIGCFGRLSAQKNQSALLRALAMLQRGGFPARLLLVGSGEDEARLRHLARALSLEASLDWAGEVSDARPFYARCDIVALPSRWEGCPYSLLEAMAARRAVVAADIAPLREILGAPGEGLGLLCAPTPEPLARALMELARSPQRRQVLGAAARARIERDFTLERMADETARVYAEVSCCAH
jgi:glycosyltransferase involved in cell wall biosynthesis